MQSHLVIYLHANDAAHPSWAVVGADHVVKQEVYRDTQPNFALLAENKKVIVIVPAEDVQLTSLSLPKMNRHRFMQALAYALEEQCIAETESLHFAITQQDKTHVAITSHAKMEQWLALLQTWKIRPDVMMPLSLVVPYDAKIWQVMIHEMTICRYESMESMVCDNPNFFQYAEALLASTIEKPTEWIIQNYTTQRVEKQLIGNVMVREIAHPAHQWIGDIASFALKSASINLIQGKYANKKSKFDVHPLGKNIKHLVKAIAALLFLYPLGSLLILHTRANEIDHQIEDIYRHHFPLAKTVSSPKAHLEEKLQQIQTSRIENRLLLLLAEVGEAMKKNNKILLKRLAFESNQLMLTISTTSPDDLRLFSDDLAGLGLKVKQQATTSMGSRVLATIQVE